MKYRRPQHEPIFQKSWKSLLKAPPVQASKSKEPKKKEKVQDAREMSAEKVSKTYK